MTDSGSNEISSLRERFKSIKKSISENNFSAAFSELRDVARPNRDFSIQHMCASMFNAIPKESLSLKRLKIAIVATSTVDHFAAVFRFWMALEGFDVETFIAEFDTMSQTVIDPQSELYSFNPDIVWLFSSYRDVVSGIPVGGSGEELGAWLNSATSSSAALWNIIKERLSCHIIQNNADMPVERVFGNFDGSVPWGRQSALRAYNCELSRIAGDGATIFDIDFLSAIYGKNSWFDDRYWHHSKHAFSLDASGIVAFQAARLIGAIYGRARKCLVLDLDNTLWGGVIGDDGLEGIRIGVGADGEAFVDFQKYVLSLKNRGIVLAVCSKNEEETAKLPFLQQPDMVLKLDDIAVFKANWNNKADNISEIARTLNIGLDSIVFVDDNQYERSLVRGILPIVAVPDMPEDPALYVRALDSMRYFETITFSGEDKERAAMYRLNSERASLQSKFDSVEDYLIDLDMEAHVSDFEPGSLSRISQLINKSNQFHLTTTRYTEPEILDFMKDPKNVCLQFRLKDRLGDNGLIALVIMKESGGEDLLVDTWVMSCRVLSRGMEEFVQGELVRAARSRGRRRIVGRYIPTAKNKIVEKHYQRLGYTLLKEEDASTLWELLIDDSSPLPAHFIRRAGGESPILKEHDG